MQAQQISFPRRPDLGQDRVARLSHRSCRKRGESPKTMNGVDAGSDGLRVESLASQFPYISRLVRVHVVHRVTSATFSVRWNAAFLVLK